MNRLFFVSKEYTPTIIVLLVALLSLSACTSHQIYRENFLVCVSDFGSDGVF